MGNKQSVAGRIRATVVQTNGNCKKNHRSGDIFDVSCYDAGGMCGFFYHAIFSNLQTFEFGGRMPWWPDGFVMLNCPDPHNTVTIKIERISE